MPFPLRIDTTTLGADQGFIIQGDFAIDWAGYGVASAGDVNGDGIDDLIVGAPHGDDGGTHAGEAYVVFGTRAGFGSDVGGRQVIDLTTLSAAQGFIVQGDAAADLTGRSVASAGDVNGDGIDDLIVGAYRGDDGGSNAGEAYVIFGTRAGFGSDVGGRQVIDLTNMSAAQGFIVQGDLIGDQAGYAVSSAGDVNGDGIDDLIVGAPFGNDGGGDAGEAYVVFGSRAGFGSDVGGRQVIDLTSLGAAQGFLIQGDGVDDRAGNSVSSAGDVNGDGIDDLIVGAPHGDDGGTDAGEAYVVFGSRDGFGSDVGGRQVIDLTSLGAAQGFIVRGDAFGDIAGWSVSGAGDVNGDGIDDLIVGAPLGEDGGADAGEAYVVFGTRAGFGTNVTGRQVIDLTSLTPAQGFVIQGDDVDDGLGGSVSRAGDVNGDGIDDLIVGANNGDDGGVGAGEAYVVFGSRTGFGSAVGGRQVLDLTDLTTAQGFAIQGDALDDQLGVSVSAAGDINGDGVDDLIVGAIRGDDGGADAGEAYVIFGVAENSAPVAVNDLFATDELTVATGNLFANNGSGADSDPDGPPLAITAVNGSALNVGSQITLASGALLTVSADGTFSYDPNGAFQYVPGSASGASNLIGTDSFTYSLGGNTATVTIDVSGIDNNDLVRGSSGNDTLDGGRGTNTLSYADAGAGVFANIGVGGPNDTVGAGIDTLSNFVNLTGSDYADELRGSAVANILDGGSGADAMLGGDGDDTYYADVSGDRVLEAADEGHDTVLSLASYVLPDDFEVEELRLIGTGQLTGSGNRYDNVIIGNSEYNALGGYGGNDRLDGGVGPDLMKGGLGDDTYVVSSAGDWIWEWDGQGTDTVETSVDFTLPGCEIENVTATGSGAVNITGNAIGNVLTGNNAVNWINGAGGNDRIDGGGGADVMAGGLGDDIFVVDNTGDRIKESAGQGSDTVETALTFSLQGLEVDNLTLTGANAVDGTGNGLANLLIGNDAANALLGYDGADTLRGGGGDDVLRGMGGSDRMEGGAGADRFYFDVAPGAGNIDTIADLEAGVDSIWLRRAMFDGMAAGVLSADAFAIGVKAADASDRILYDVKTGALWFDPDGTGAAGAVQFATLGTGLSLTAADFTIY